MTSVQALFEIELPIIQAPMAGVQGSALAVAVSNAGGPRFIAVRDARRGQPARRAGGHRGMFLTEDLSSQIGTLNVLPQIVRAVRVPVVAAGGIADAKGVAAAMSLGAAAVQVGTAYLLCPEATTSALHRLALKDQNRETALTNVVTGRAARGIVNRAIRELGPISPFVPPFPLAAVTMAPLRAKAESMGHDDFSPLWAGTNTRGCKEMPAALLTRELASLTPR